MNTKIMQEEKEDILNDILNDKISIKIVKNEDNSFQLNFHERITNKVVYDTYKIFYDKNITDLNLATVSLLMLNELDSTKNTESPNSPTPSNYDLSYKSDKSTSYRPRDLVGNYNYGLSYVESYYSKNMEKILSKISSSFIDLPRLPENEKTPGIYNFDDKSVIYLRRHIISGCDGPADCGSELIATSNFEQLNSRLIKEYSAFGKEKSLNNAITSKKTDNLKSVIEFIFGQKNDDKKVISFNNEKIEDMRAKLSKIEPKNKTHEI